MDDPLTYLAVALGINPALLAVAIPIAIVLFNLLGRAIPDDAVGFLGLVRRVAKVLGLYLSNRVASGVSVNNVAKVAAGLKDVDEVAGLIGSKLDVGEPVTQGIAGITRGPGGQFTKTQSPWFVTLILFGLIAMLFSLGGCANKDIITTVCSRSITIRAIANATLKEAYLIPDPVKQRIAIEAANRLLDSIANCPPVGTPGSI